MLRCSCRLSGLFAPVARWDQIAQHLAHHHTRSSKPFHVDHTELTLEPAADGLVVLYVAPDAPGARAGLRKGDQIISVDGLSLRAPRRTTQVDQSGHMAFRARNWFFSSQLVELPTTFQIRPSERDGLPCWEAYFLPVSTQLEANTKHELTGVGS